MSEIINYRGILVGDEEKDIAVTIAESEKREKENAFRDSVVEENREKLAEQEKAKEEKVFYEAARRDFFVANPTASEAEFKKLLPKLREEYLLDSFRKFRAQGQESLITELYSDLN